MKISLVVFFLTIIVGYGQSTNVSVSYGLLLEQEKGLFENNASLKSYLERAIVDAKQITFQLVITKNGSKFYDEDLLENESNRGSKRFALSMAHYTGIVYMLEDKLLLQKSLLGENIYSQEDIKSNWILSNETKLIGDYLCCKATTIFTVVNENRVFNHPVVAWYCPKLPYSYGAVGYGDLPGLILELRVRNAVFGVRDINFKTDLNFDLNFLNKIKILNEKEIEEAYSKFDGF
jgi:GLPGLI family protein